MLKIAEWMWAQKASDGAIEADACMEMFGREKFENKYTSSYYAASANHFDITCLNGDGVTDEARICSWFASRT